MNENAICWGNGKFCGAYNSKWHREWEQGWEQEHGSGTGFDTIFSYHCLQGLPTIKFELVGANISKRGSLIQEGCITHCISVTPLLAGLDGVLVHSWTYPAFNHLLKLLAGIISPYNICLVYSRCKNNHPSCTTMNICLNHFEFLCCLELLGRTWTCYINVQFDHISLTWWNSRVI